MLFKLFDRTVNFLHLYDSQIRVIVATIFCSTLSMLLFGIILGSYKLESLQAVFIGIMAGVGINYNIIDPTIDDSLLDFLYFKTIRDGDILLYRDANKRFLMKVEEVNKNKELKFTIVSERERTYKYMPFYSVSRLTVKLYGVERDIELLKAVSERN